jgi:general secretion pathway protein B
MSILLDALKKSEQQRQLGSTPNGESPAASPAASSSSGRKWVLLALLVISVVSVAWFGWHQYRQPDTVAVSRSAAESQLRPAPPAGQARVANAVKAGPSTAGLPQRTPVETFSADSEPGQGSGAVPAPESATPGLEKSRVNRSFKDFEAPPKPVSAARQVSPDSALSGAVEAPAPQTAAKPPRPATPPAAATEPITFWELPQGIRDGLPDLRITVLVFAEQPQDRFVLIGGQRRVENDQLQDGLVLEQIRRDGAVFTYRNYRFLVKG